MRYIAESHGSSHEAKLFGTYEKELHSTVTEWAQCRPRNLVVAGAAEGYYAVGFARILPESKVVAFEKEPEAQHMLRTLCAVNQVTRRVEIRGECTRPVLEDLLRTRRPDGVWMDVEGQEKELLTDSVCRAGQDTFFLVELHPWVDRGLGARIEKLFSPSHQTRVLPSLPRRMGDLPFSPLVRWFCGPDLLARADEGRPEPMNWLVAWPRCRPGHSPGLGAKVGDGGR